MLNLYFFSDPAESSDPVYFKKCYPTPFHAKGCLTVDEEEVRFRIFFMINLFINLDIFNSIKKILCFL